MDLEQFLDQPVLGFFSGGAFALPDGRVRELISPVTGRPWKHYAVADRNATLQAIAAANTAFSSWKRTPAPERARFLRHLGDLILKHRKELAHTMAMEIGKPVTQGEGEAAYAAGYFHWFAGEAERIYGQSIPSQFADKRLEIRYEPVGVVAALTPWNFPLAMAARKIAAALAAGCTAINRPSDESPVTMLLFGWLCQQAGLPEGVVTVLPGSIEEVSQILLESPVVKKVSFTGSTPVGKLLYAQCAPTLKKLTLELGGHAPLLVFDDADPALAAREAARGKFRNNGQTCVCPNRFYVQEGIYTTFMDCFIAEVKKLKVGDPLDPASDLSAILHPSSLRKTVEHLKDALAKGAELILRGEDPYHPAIVANITPEMLLYREETFGPLAGIRKFATEEEGLTMANASSYGLAAYLFTNDLSRAERALQRLECGIIGVNDGVPSTSQASFGGVKQSGFGREGGPTGLRDYLVEKYVSMRYHS